MVIDYQIAVVGAGIVGASIAARLASLGISVALLDKGTAGGQGASSYSGGLVRLYDADPLLMELAAMSIKLMATAPFVDTYTRALRRTGLIHRAAPDQAEPLRAAIERYATERYPMQLLADHELHGTRFPRCAPGQRLNLYEPHACVGNVRQAVSALAEVVRSNGLLLEHCALTAMDCRSRHEVLLSVGDATLRCRAVVIAAGAWSWRWMAQPGLHTRSIPLARVHCAAAWSTPVIDAVSRSYAIPLTGEIIQTGCALRAAADCPEALPGPDPRHGEDACAQLGRLVAGLPQARLLDVLPGFDGYSPDGRPLLGFSDAESPVYLAAGLSGVGFKLAPAIAQIAAEQLQRHLADAAPAAHWTALSPTRLPVDAAWRAQP